jgi:hypothetical protein
MVRQNACGPDVLHPRGFVCRDKAGPCDVADQCPGGDSQCPPDAKEVINTPCNPSRGICDVPELCDGSSNLCPRDEFRPASANFVCRDPNGDCDLRRDVRRHERRLPGRQVRCRRARAAPPRLATRATFPRCVSPPPTAPPDGFRPFNSRLRRRLRSHDERRVRRRGRLLGQVSRRHGVQRPQQVHRGHVLEGDGSLHLHADRQLRARRDAGAADQLPASTSRTASIF